MSEFGKLRRGLVVFGVAGWSVIGPGLKATAAESTEKQTMEEISVTAHRIDTLLKEVPASVGVITRKDIQQLQPNKLSELFRYEPGVNVEQSGSRHGEANINIRGIGGNRVLILKDGVRMPDGFGSAGTDQGRGSFSAFNLGRVEVLKGPASALYGSDALGGVVLLKSLDAQSLVEQNEGETVMQFSGGYNSVDERSRGSFLAASELGAGYGLLQIEGQSFSETDINGNFQPNPKDANSQSLLAIWAHQPTDEQRWEWLVNLWQQEADNRLNTNLGPISGPPGSAITEALAKDESTRWHVGVRHEVDNLAWLDKLKWQLDYQSSGYDQTESEKQESRFTAIQILEQEEFEQKQWSANLQIEKALGDHSLVTGIDLSQRELTRPVDRQQIDLRTGEVSRNYAGVNYPGKTYPDTDIEQYGVYLQDVYRPTDAWRLVAGVRFDYYSSSPSVDEAYANFNTSNTQIDSRSDSKWSPYLGVTYLLSDTAELYASATTGFRAPPVDDQFISRAILIPVPGVPHEVVPNNELDPETSKGFELGWRWQGERLSLQAAYYQNQYKDFIDSKTIGYRAQAPVFIGPTSIRQIQYQNLEEVHISGIELGAQLNLPDLLPNNWNSYVKVAANVIDGEDQSTKRGLNSVGPHNATVGFHANNAAENLGFAWHMRVSDKADDAEPLRFRGQSLPSFEPPGYSVHDFSFFWKPTRQINVDLSLYNLFDKRYWSAHEKGANAAGNLEATLASGRSVALTLSYQI